VAHPEPERFISLFEKTLKHDSTSQVTEMIANTVAAIFRLGLANISTWAKFTRAQGFRHMIRHLVLYEPRQEIRHLMGRLIEDTVRIEAEEQSREAASVHETGPLTSFLWSTLSGHLREAEDYATQSYNFFKTCTILLQRVSAFPCETSSGHIRKTANDLCELLLNHESIEVR
jgi:hypothetical protein